MRSGLFLKCIAIAGFLGGNGIMASSAAEPSTTKPLADAAAGAKPCTIEDLKRPYVLLTGERLEQLRRAIASSGRKRDYYEQVLKPSADRWQARSITIPERAGHYHNFVCTDGTRLPVPEDQQFETTGSYTCGACGTFYSGEKFDGARRNYEHLWLMSAARDLALVGALSHEKKYTEKAAEILVKYADAYPGRHTKNIEGGIFYQSLDESMYMVPLAQAYDLVYDAGILSNADKAHIERDLFWECAAGLVACGSTTNWGSWHLSAAGVIGLATKHQALIDHGTKQFQRQIRDELGDDGLWPESVHTYHFFPLGAFVSFAEASTNAGTDLWQWEARPGKGLKAMFTTPLRYMYPDMRLAAINDGWFEAFLPVDQYEAAYSRFKDPEMAWAVAERRKGGGDSAGAAIRDGIWSFVAGEELPEKIEQPALPSTDFPVLGICTLRTGGDPARETMLTFDYGRHLGHGQLDKMGITLFSGGRLLAADYGTPSYGSPILPFYKGTSSHNTIAVDGQDQKATKRSELLAFRDTPLVKLASARTDEAYPGVDWRRTVLLMDDYVLVVDDLASTQSRTYDWLFHAEGEKLDLEQVVKLESGPALPYKYLEDVTGYGLCPASPADASPGYTARWPSADGGGLTLISSCTSDTQVFAVRSPAETAVRKVPMLVQRAEGRKARFVVVLKPGPRPAGEEGEVKVSNDRDGRILVHLGGVPTAFSVSDGEITVERNGGRGQPEKIVAEMKRPL